MDMPQSTGTPARDARLRRGWTLRDLAARCAEKGAPVDHGQLARIERRSATPRPRLRAVLADLLELDVLDLEKTDDEPTGAASPDVAVHGVRSNERAVPEDVPDLPDARVTREAS